MYSIKDRQYGLCVYIYIEIVYICISICGPFFFGYVLCLSAAIIRTTHRSGYIALAVCGGVEAQEEKPQQQCVSHSYIYVCRSSYRMFEIASGSSAMCDPFLI